MDLRERRSDTPVRHPWEQARARFFHDLAHEIVGPDRTVRWLDVGAGDAWLGMQLAAHLPAGSSMTCWDVNYSDDDLETLAERSPDITFSVDRPDLRADVVSLLDVIEHVDDDVGLVQSIVAENLAPGGVVVVSVPAYQALFTEHDVALAHHRRYSPAQCRAVLRSGGLRVERDGGLFTTLLAPRAVQAGIERVRPPRESSTQGIGGWARGPLLTTSVSAVLTADYKLSQWCSRRGLRLPGLSYWAVCSRADR